MNLTRPSKRDVSEKKMTHIMFSQEVGRCLKKNGIP